MATTPNPATTEWVPLWDLNGIALSSVPPHHVTHETGGVDAITSLSGTTITSGTIADARLSINVLKYTGGYPGGTANFLRADGTFSPPTVPGPPSPHAATHNLGGSDPLVNAAWLNQPNIFTQDQTINKTNAALTLIDPSQPLDNKVWRVLNTNRTLYLQATNDAITASIAVVSVDRTGVLTAAGLGSTPLNASNLTSGTVPAARLTNVAILDVPNIFTQNQKITGIRPTWEVQFSGDSVTGRIFQAIATNRIDISANLSYDGANWNADDISQIGTVYIQQYGRHDFYIAPAGPNPRSGVLNLHMSVAPTGTTIPAGLATTPLNASQITSGTVPDANLSSNVAFRTIDNRFYPQTFASYSSITGPNSLLGFYDTSGVVDARYWRLLQYSDGNLWLEALNDPASIYQGRFAFNRAGQFGGLLDASSLDRGTIPDARFAVNGTWTPVIGGTGGEGTQFYNFQTGHYIKIGRYVHFWSYTQFADPNGDNTGKGPISGNLILKGLPFPIAGLPGFFAGHVAYSSNLAPSADIYSAIDIWNGGNNSYMNIYGRRMGGNPLPLTGADVNSHTQFITEGSYLTNS